MANGINSGVEESIPIWKIAGQHVREMCRTGRTKTFESPIDMWNAAEEYFRYVDDNPIVGEEIKNDKTGLKRVKVRYRRAYTLEELQLHCGVGHGFFSQFEEKHKAAIGNGTMENFQKVIKEIKDTIRKQQFDGATAGQFKENIIARMMGLAEKTENLNINSAPLSKQEILDISKELEDGY